MVPNAQDPGEERTTNDEKEVVARSFPFLHYSELASFLFSLLARRPVVAASSHDPEFGERTEKRGSENPIPPFRHALSGPVSPDKIFHQGSRI